MDDPRPAERGTVVVTEDGNVVVTTTGELSPGDALVLSEQIRDAARAAARVQVRLRMRSAAR